MILVSACLCGFNCRYDGNNNLNSKIIDMINKGEVIPICPEQLGGLSTPRAPAEIQNGTGLDVLKGNAIVKDKNGFDKTDSFLKGAYRTLKLAQALDIRKAILKQKSPSCGFGKIYNGNFSGNIIKGNGLTAQLLTDNGIEVVSNENI